MECCSPDVGDCQKCHPELWIQKGGSFCNWIPKLGRKKTRTNRKVNKLSRPQITRKNRK
jgi:hypothetical protein